ncbi:DUF3164 family protein [Mucilaginibacter sp. RCC_168]|uniref:DUF3164 family protein n=1 Tax=Mucilaginibacter sp. RCC_168 TaxID=3239221 RepID=UPI003524D68C
MNTLTIKAQAVKEPFWLDEEGKRVDIKRITPYERQSERAVYNIAKQAMAINKQLADFKTKVNKEATELYQAFIIENNGKPKGKGKGGNTVYNFDRSIKLEVSIGQPITFDDNLIDLAKQKLDEILEDGLQGAKDFIKEWIMGAFETSRGKMDTKRVLGLSKYESRVDDPRYTEAMALIKRAIRRPESKEYFRVWVKGQNNQYQDIQLNFSAI